MSEQKHKTGNIYLSEMCSTYVADFETTIDSEETKVWSCAITAIDNLVKDKVTVVTSMKATFEEFMNLKRYEIQEYPIDVDLIPKELQEVNTIYQEKTTSYVQFKVSNVYFHNLKFDGKFIISYLLKNGYNQFKPNADDTDSWLFTPNTFYPIISDMGQIYMIGIRFQDNIVLVKNSLLLIPLSVAEIGQSYGTKYRKTSIDYDLHTDENEVLTDEEIDYIRNDVLVVAEALKLMFEQGINGLTIGSSCISIFKQMYSPKFFYDDFVSQNRNIPKIGNIDSFIRKSYFGGFCYVQEGVEDKLYYNGCTFDVNSLYPSVMLKESGNEYPYGEVINAYDEDDLKGYDTQYFCDLFKERGKYRFIRFKCRFTIKSNYIPFIHIRHIKGYKVNECLKTSKLGDRDEIVEMTLAQTDFEMMCKHYDITDFTPTAMIEYNAKAGMFDEYINKFGLLKQQAKGGLRQIYKLLLNNLYGKFGTKIIRESVECYLNDESVLKFTIPENAHETQFWGYIPVASACTAYARKFTITACQANYKYFLYSDTDSVHLSCTADRAVGIPIHDTKFLHWKNEKNWEIGIFVRQKTYIEVENGEYDIKACGLGKRCKELFELYLNYYEMTTDITKKRANEILTKRLKKIGENNDITIDNDDLLNDDEISERIIDKYVDSFDLDEDEYDWLMAMIDSDHLYKADGNEKSAYYNVRLCDENKEGLLAFTEGLMIPSNLKAKTIKGGVVLTKQPFKLNGRYLTRPF